MLEQPPEPAGVLELHDKLQVVPRIRLMHGGEFEAEVLPDLGQFFFRVRLFEAQVVDPKNPGLRARERAGRIVGGCRKLVPQKRRDRQDFERFALRQGDEVCIREPVFDQPGRAPVKLQQRARRRPVGGRFLDQFARRAPADLRGRPLEQVILLRDQPLAGRPGFPEREPEPQPFADEKFEPLAAHGE